MGGLVHLQRDRTPGAQPDLRDLRTGPESDPPSRRRVRFLPLGPAGTWPSGVPARLDSAAAADGPPAGRSLARCVRGPDRHGEPEGEWMMELDVILKRFEQPDETREMVMGRFDLVHIGGLTIGRATYQPGWRWSLHVGPAVGAARCSVEHVGLVLSGTATAAFEDGRVYELRAGQVFYIPPVPHDSWVVGEEPYVSLHLLGSERYAR